MAGLGAAATKPMNGELIELDPWPALMASWLQEGGSLNDTCMSLSLHSDKQGSQATDHSLQWLTVWTHLSCVYSMLEPIQ